MTDIEKRKENKNMTDIEKRKENKIMTDIERKSNILITLNNEYLKAATAEPGSDSRLLHERTCNALLADAYYLYGYEFMDRCMNFLKAVDAALTLWKERNAK